MASSVQKIKVRRALCLILRAALDVPDDGYRAELSEILVGFAENDWNSLLNLAGQQTVRGLLYSGLSRLEGEWHIPDIALGRMMSDLEDVESRTDSVIALSRRICTRLSEYGIPAVLMKGPSVGEYYPDPSLRESGDIDIYIPADYADRAVQCLGRGTGAPDGSMHFSVQSVDIDIHPRYFDLHAPERLLPPVPSLEATLLMLSSHILKHAIGPGVGLRQICDMAVVCRAMEGRYDMEKLQSIYSSLGLRRWNADLNAFIKDALGIDIPLFRSSRHRSGALGSIIFSGGDFGHHASGRLGVVTGTSSARRKTDTLLRMVRRIKVGMRWSPREYFLRLLEIIHGNILKP